MIDKVNPKMKEHIIFCVVFSQDLSNVASSAVHLKTKDFNNSE